jgi:hypothetical protein
MIVNADLVLARDDETLSEWLDMRRQVESGEFYHESDYGPDTSDREDFHSDG